MRIIAILPVIGLIALAQDTTAIRVLEEKLLVSGRLSLNPDAGLERDETWLGSRPLTE